MQTFINSFTFFGQHPGLMWDKTLAHLAITFAAVGVAVAIAIPLGVWLGHLHRASFLAINVSNASGT
jgi:osmoprotectant transport system permease protein